MAVDDDGWSSSLPSQASAPWFGVTVSTASGRVTAVDLSGNGLAGTLAELVPHLRVLVGLRSLRLGGNALRGFLPAELACPKVMPELQVLDLSRNPANSHQKATQHTHLKTRTRQGSTSRRTRRSTLVDLRIR